jgi:hypothetical protein
VIWQWLAASKRPRRPLASEIPHPPKRTVPPPPVITRAAVKEAATPPVPATVTVPVTLPAASPIRGVTDVPEIVAVPAAVVESIPETAVAVSAPDVATVAAAPMVAMVAETPIVAVAVEPEPAPLPVIADEAAPPVVANEAPPPALIVAATLTTIDLPTSGPSPADLSASLQSPFAVTANGTPLPFDLAGLLLSPMAVTASESAPIEPSAAAPIGALADALADFARDLGELVAGPAAGAPAPEAPAEVAGSRRRVSATRDLHDPTITAESTAAGMTVPDSFNPETLAVTERHASWQDGLRLSITADGQAKDDWQGTTSMTLLRQILASPLTWRETMDHLGERGITHADLIPTLAVAEARGWVAITSGSPDESLDLAAFLRDTGLLGVDQVATMISDSQAFRECRFDALCKELVGKKILTLAKAGFLNRLGRLATWHVVPATTFATAEAI